MQVHLVYVTHANHCVCVCVCIFLFVFFWGGCFLFFIFALFFRAIAAIYGSFEARG